MLNAATELTFAVVVVSFVGGALCVHKLELAEMLLVAAEALGAYCLLLLCQGTCL